MVWILRIEAQTMSHSPPQKYVVCKLDAEMGRMSSDRDWDGMLEWMHLAHIVQVKRFGIGRRKNAMQIYGYYDEKGSFKAPKLVPIWPI